LGLKNSGGGGGGGAITCFEDTIGSPANAATAWKVRVVTAKATNRFIEVVFLTKIQLLLIGSFSMAFLLLPASPDEFRSVGSFLPILFSMSNDCFLVEQKFFGSEAGDFEARRT
jgi:hypothetical protein